VAADRRHYKPFEQHLVMAQDVAAAIQNILLLAHVSGLGACWVSLITDMHMQRQRAIYRQLQLPPYIFVGGAIALGYPAAAVCDVPRRPLSQVWFREKFARPREASAAPAGSAGLRVEGC
jgi:nitroreductase